MRKRRPSGRALRGVARRRKLLSASAITLSLTLAGGAAFAYNSSPLRFGAHVITSVPICPIPCELLPYVPPVDGITTGQRRWRHWHTNRFGDIEPQLYGDGSGQYLIYYLEEGMFVSFFWVNINTDYIFFQVQGHPPVSFPIGQTEQGSWDFDENLTINIPNIGNIEYRVRGRFSVDATISDTTSVQVISIDGTPFEEIDWDNFVFGSTPSLVLTPPAVILPPENDEEIGNDEYDDVDDYDYDYQDENDELIDDEDDEYEGEPIDPPAEDPYDPPYDDEDSEEPIVDDEIVDEPTDHLADEPTDHLADEEPTDHLVIDEPGEELDDDEAQSGPMRSWTWR
jgi:hypothetical protein